MKPKRKRLLAGFLSIALTLALMSTAFAASGPGPASSNPPAVARHTLYNDLGSAFGDYLTAKAGSESLGNLEKYFNSLADAGKGFDIGGGRELVSGDLGKTFGALGKAFNIASVAKDISSYTDSSRHKHDSLEFLDNCFRGWAIGLSTIGAEIPYAGDAIAFIRDVFGGESVSDYFNGINKGDNAFLDSMDSLVNSMNLGVQDFYGLVAEMWGDFYNWMMEVVGPGQDGEVDVEKPNIYLYSETPTEVSVTFTQPELLLTTIPLYDSGGKEGWQVSVGADGTLLADGKKYGFLFYESIASPADFQTKKGFMVKAGNRAEQFEEILDAYGFNQTEKADFIAYWTQRLNPDRDYAMYPQATERVNALMPIHVSQTPDHIFRLWFGFRTTDEQPEAPAIVPFERGGFTVIEWGGAVLDEK